MFRFENLEIWQEAIIYAKQVYSLTASFPKEEQYSLVSQLRRSAVSVSANIAEGAASSTTKEFQMFLSYSIRSLAENISEFAFAKEQSYVSEEQYKKAYSEAERLIKRITTFKKTLA
ncbi:four helix bundle protein [Patescibacteria group bacterium]|nr:four helix bundle protein [Patescibacteria group bacterium]MBU0963668.1 four helix bundle protein [Patescibacteria group bacterium]